LLLPSHCELPLSHNDQYFSALIWGRNVSADSESKVEWLMVAVRWPMM
jgi:hypothetical protein